MPGMSITYRYDAAGGQTQLKPHRDGSVVSFNIALNPSSEFEGGGTYFKGLESQLKGEGLRIEQVSTEDYSHPSLCV